MLNISKSILWLLLTIFFGLLQLWIVIGSSFVINNYSYNFDHILVDGVLLFFMSALVISLTIDYHFSKRKYSKWATGILFIFFPLVITLIAVWLFSICFNKDMGELNLEVIKGIEFTVLSMSALYVIIEKTLEYSQKE